MNAKQKKYLQPLLLGVGVLVAIKAYSAFKAGKSLFTGIATDIKTSVQSTQMDAALSSNGVTGVDSSQVIRIGEEIYAALHKNAMWGLLEDEELAITAFNRLTSVPQAKALAGVYQANYGKNLYQELKKYLSLGEFNELKTYLINGIK